MKQTKYPDAVGIDERHERSLVDDAGKPFGEIEIEVIRDGPHGPEVRQRRKLHNLIVLSGKKQIWRLVGGLQTKLFDQGRVGTSGATPTSSDTNVKSPVASTLQTVDTLTLEAGTRTFQWSWSYPSGGGSISATGIRECALLNENTSPGGSCMQRSVFTSVSKTTSDKLRITYRARIT